LGNPLDFILTPGQAHDLEGADALLPDMAAETLLADKAFDADERVIEPLLARGKTFVIPPKSSRKVQRDFDKDAYKARHLIENFFCKLKQYRAIATRYDKTARNFPRRNPSRGRYHLAQLRTGPSTKFKKSCRLQVQPFGLSNAPYHALAVPTAFGDRKFISEINGKGICPSDPPDLAGRVQGMLAASQSCSQLAAVKR